MAFARNGDVEIYFETFGPATDPALLLINGLGSQCVNYRVELCEGLAALGYFVIRYDNRDVGLSSKMDESKFDVRDEEASLARDRRSRRGYLLSDMARDGLAVLDALNVSRAHVVGASMGGMIAQTMAIENPERLLSLTSFMSTTGDPDVGQPSERARELLLGARSTDRESYVATQLECAKVWGSPACFNEEFRTAVAQEAFDRNFCPAGVGRQLWAIRASGSRTVALGALELSTLVLHGDEDTLIDISGGRRTAEAIPGARFVVIEGLGHDYPPQYWDQLISLLETHLGGEQV
jgi:pimeloyl-ACP methyl ester carboxylesterase